MAWTQIFPLASGPLNRIIVHDGGSSSGGGFCITLDFATKLDLDTVYGALFSRNDSYGNWDEGQGSSYHQHLHTEMMTAMGVTSMASTLTTYHQHWVHRSQSGKDSFKLDLLTADQATTLVVAMFTEKYIVKPNMVQLGKFIGS